MNQAVYAILNFNEGAKVCQVSDTAMDTRANLLTFVQCLPWIILNLFHAQANAARLGIYA
jgi:hypothetical protein